MSAYDPEPPHGTPYSWNIAGGSIYYEVRNDGLYGDGEYISIVDSDVTVTAVYIPSEINGVPVKEIGDKAFFACSDLRSLTMAEGIQYIGSRFLDFSDSLRSISIPDSVTAIGDEAFWSCQNLETVEFGSGLESIGDKAFSNCHSLRDFDLPPNLKTIGEGAFECCVSVKKIVIPDSVYSVGDGAFCAMYALESITTSKNMEVIPYMFCSYCTNLQYINIAEGTTTLENSAFDKTGIFTDHLTVATEEINLPKTIKTIKEYAFYITDYSNGDRPEAHKIKKVNWDLCEEGVKNVEIESRGNELFFAADEITYGEHESEYKSDRNFHWKGCKYCDEATGEKEEHIIDETGFCSVCGFDSRFTPADVNSDSAITLDDAILTLQWAMQVGTDSGSFNAQAADVTADGSITLDDAIEILKIAMKVNS